MIQGVIFDFDNTLYDYDVNNKRALDKLFHELNKKSSIPLHDIICAYDKINKNIKGSNNPSNKFNKAIYVKKLLEEFNIQLLHLDYYLQIYHKSFFDELVLYSGVVEFLVFLKSKNIKISLVSNNQFYQQYEKLRELNILSYIDCIHTSDECGHEKPDLNMFLEIQHKMGIPFDKLAYIGDDYICDIEPSLRLGMFSFLFVGFTAHLVTYKPRSSVDVTDLRSVKSTDDEENIEKCTYSEKKYIKFGSYYDILHFFQEYFLTVDNLVSLSKFFGQSEYNVQGPGGNISIKMGDLLFIKSSGFILGNMCYEQGYCILHNPSCVNMVNDHVNNVKTAKIFGYNHPSMETYFHSFMKKYTVHLHFTPSNVWFCSNAVLDMTDFIYNKTIIDYFTPGIELSHEIHSQYTDDCDIYFLKNHGVIITANTIEEIYVYYDYLFVYFKGKNSFLIDSEKILQEQNCMTMCRMFNKKRIVKCTNFGHLYDELKNMIFCFPDLAVFVQKIIIIYWLNPKFTEDYDIIFYDENVYVSAENITKCYSLIEILQSYIDLYCHVKRMNNTTELISIKNDVLKLQTMEEEILRRK
jgi:putative hydrolase of the HAD superfamily